MADSAACRRAGILRFFGETPKYDRCGTCDNCLAQEQHGGDLRRDFSGECSLVLGAVSACTRPQAMTTLTLIITGAYQKGSKGNAVDDSAVIALKVVRDSAPQHAQNKDFIREIVAILVEDGMLERESKSVKTPGGYTSSFEVLKCTAKGKQWVASKGPLLLPGTSGLAS